MSFYDYSCSIVRPEEKKFLVDDGVCSWKHWKPTVDTVRLKNSCMEFSAESYVTVHSSGFFAKVFYGERSK